LFQKYFITNYNKFIDFYIQNYNTQRFNFFIFNNVSSVEFNKTKVYFISELNEKNFKDFLIKKKILEVHLEATRKKARKNALKILDKRQEKDERGT